ncbi:ABC transporter permease [Mycoplasma zalophidermidis]|uniref:ABC transporter permease n=1 Tax=Mycoplasma zalophidermidis TaxID=398174 RepID=A0ABS6DSK0_9MOLU|nr:ABC transporter permease [Mycoplasma zalophidermidis]MBU4690007.1 ABC transporter permease [Mycoplasma zalophidermidis]MBU4693839.1 ABC transporter permease [Mycoplasma zalophidermidis]MCR8966854.1 ABC transporter permease [Mycoplasma zalophidermidis]
MFKYIFKRMALAILTLFIILIFSYTLIVIFIKNPYEIKLINETDNLLRQQYEAKSQAFKAIPVFTKIATYFSKFFSGDFGEIYIPQQGYNNIPELFFGPLGWSILISLPSFIISASLGILIGVLAGYKRGTWIDNLINAFVFVFIAVPSFILAPMFLNVFQKLGFDIRFISPFEIGDGWSATIKSVIPAITVVSLGSLAGYTLYSRNQVVTVLTSNYVLIAKTKGLSGGAIFRKYVLRNISIPLATIIIPSYLILLSGSIVVEKFWFIPGSATIIANSFPAGEINIVMFNIFFFTTLGLFTQVIVDISYPLIDPRIKYEASSGINLFNIISAAKKRKLEYQTMLNKQNNAAINKEGGE